MTLTDSDHDAQLDSTPPIRATDSMIRRTEQLSDLDDPLAVDLEAPPAEKDDAYRRHPPRRSCCVAVGRTWILFSCTRAYGYFPMTAHVGPHWPFMLATYAISIGPLFLVLFNDEFSTAFRWALIVSSLFTTLVFSLVACSDPGVIFESYEPLTQLQVGDNPTGGSGVICAQCQIRRPKTASHCSDCGVCVDKLDHHCPWTGKCIGRRTLWLFYVFLWSISVHIVILSVGTTLTFLKR